MPGSVTLIGGSPGIGKSTMLMQFAAMLACNINTFQDIDGGSLNLRRADPVDARWVAYVSGEESTEQLRDRADRLKLPLEHLYVLNEAMVETVLDTVHASAGADDAGLGLPSALIIDSIQTMVAEDHDGAAGSVGQVSDYLNPYMTLVSACPAVAQPVG